MTRRILVLGATGIVGEGIARSLLESGAAVVAPVRSEAKRTGLLERLRPDLPDSSSPNPWADRIEAPEFDFSTNSGLKGLAMWVKMTHGTVDGVVCSLGGHLSSDDLFSLPRAAFLEAVDARVWSQVLAARKLLGVVRDNPGSSYVVVTGKLGMRISDPKLTPYCLASSAVYGVVLSLRALQQARGGKARIKELRLGLVLRRDDDPFHASFPDAPSAPASAAGDALVALLDDSAADLSITDDPRLMVLTEHQRRERSRREEGGETAMGS